MKKRIWLFNLRLMFLLAFISLFVAQEVKATWSTCENWAYGTDGPYLYRNNIWGQSQPGGSWQCVWAYNYAIWGANAGHTSGTGQVKGYPHMGFGWVTGNGFLNPNRGNMGKKHQEYSNLKVHWNFSSPETAPAHYLSLIDLYYHWSSDPSGSTKPRTNIQIFPHWVDFGGWFDTGGTANLTYKGEKTIDGVTYRMWYKSPHPDGAAENLIHIRTATKTKNATHNVKEICAWAVSLGLMSNDEYQTAIWAGWEIIDGANGENFVTQNFWIAAENTSSSGAPIGQTIWIKANANGKYLCANLSANTSVPLQASSTAVYDWEKFDVVDAGGGDIALKAYANGKYVCADLVLGSNAPLNANRTSIGGAWEKFQWIDTGDGYFALKSLTNNKYVCANMGIDSNAPLVADRDYILGWEKFTYGITTK
jgi:hypothetical protein